jgi:hypothetical protein
MHNIEDVAWVSIFGTIGMLLAMIVVVGKLIAIYATAPPAAPTELVATGQGLNVSIGSNVPSIWGCKFGQTFDTLCNQRASSVNACGI